MSGVKEWKGFNVTATGVGDNVTFYECNLDFIATKGQLSIWNRLWWQGGRTARSCTSVSITILARNEANPVRL